MAGVSAKEGAGAENKTEHEHRLNTLEAYLFHG